MKLVRPFLLFVSILLFGWLFMSNINLINIAVIPNEAEINSEIASVNGSTDMNQLKKFTIGKISSMEVIRKRFSENVMIRMAVISMLVFIQIILYSTKSNVLNSKSTDF